MKPLAANEALAAETEFQIRIDHDPDAVSGQWGALERHATAFQTRAWLLPWFRIVAPSIDASPLFVTVADRERPLAFFPLCIRRRWGVSVVEFPDHGASDYNAPIVAPEGLDDRQAARVWSAVRASIPGVDLFHIEKMPEAFFERPNPFARLDWLRPMDLRSWSFRLPTSRQAYDSALKKKDRKEQRRKRRNLTEALGDVRLVHAAKGDETSLFFEALRMQRAARFREQHRRDILQDPVFLRFYEAVVSDRAERFAVVSMLQADRCSPATLLGLQTDDTYFLIMHSFDTACEHLSPGIVALDEMMSHLVGSGVGVCDFTIGNEPYKRQFGVEERLLYRGFDPITRAGRLVTGAMLAMRQIEAGLVRARNGFTRTQAKTRQADANPSVE